MPRISLYTNVPTSEFDVSTLSESITEAAARTIGKDAVRFMTLVHPGTHIVHAGTQSPAAFLEVASIGAIGGDKNVGIVAELSAAVTKHLSIPADRVYINFFDLSADMWGGHGTTVEKVWEAMKSKEASNA